MKLTPFDWSDQEKKKQPGGEEPKPKRPRRPRAPQTGNSNYRSGKGWIPQRDPIVLDLDGDGIETTSTTNGVYFDHNANMNMWGQTRFKRL